MQADERVARLDAMHAAAFEALAELAVEAAIPEPFIEAVDGQHLFAPRR